MSLLFLCIFLLVLLAASNVYASCRLPRELDAQSLPQPFKRIPFTATMVEDHLRIDCLSYGAKLDSTSSLFVFGGTLICENSTGKWLTDGGYEAPPIMSCLTSDGSFYAWPEYCYLFDAQDNGSMQMLIVFQGRENYCPSDSELHLVDGAEISELRCMSKEAKFHAIFRNGTSTDIKTPTTKCVKKNN